MKINFLVNNGTSIVPLMDLDLKSGIPEDRDMVSLRQGNGAQTMFNVTGRNWRMVEDPETRGVSVGLDVLLTQVAVLSGPSDAAEDDDDQEQPYADSDRARANAENAAANRAQVSRLLKDNPQA